jgi:hypothetical protein
MDENNTFRDALSNFTFDVACGGAIAHLADCGYMPQEIHKMLDFPTSYERVQETFWKNYLKKKIIAEEKSELGKSREKVSFVTDYDAYGHMSLRKVVEYEEEQIQETDLDEFQTSTYNPDTHGLFSSFLREYCCEAIDEENAVSAYVSCDFGLRMRRSPEEYEKFLSPLTGELRIYMEGMPWRRKVVWHQLNKRMTEIITILYEQSAYHGTILLLDKKEQINF